MDTLFFFFKCKKSCSWTRAIAHGDNNHSDLLDIQEELYLLLTIESLIQSQVLLLFFPKHMLKGQSLLVKNKIKEST